MCTTLCFPRSVQIPQGVSLELASLYANIERLRTMYGIAQRGAQIWQATFDTNTLLVVIADGLGGATLRYGCGIGSVNAVIIGEIPFTCEAEACSKASACVRADGTLDPDQLQATFKGRFAPEPYTSKLENATKSA